MAVPMRLANRTCLGLFTILSTPEASCWVIALGSGHQAGVIAPTFHKFRSAHNTPMSALGQTRKCRGCPTALQLYPKSGHSSLASACPFRAKSRPVFAAASAEANFLSGSGSLPARASTNDHAGYAGEFGRQAGGLPVSGPLS